MSIGGKITKLRKENNMTQEQLADLMCVSVEFISRLESNGVCLETDKLLQLSNIFNCSVDYLLKDELLDKNVTKVEVKEVFRMNSTATLILISMLVIIMILGFSLSVVLLKDIFNWGNNYKDTELCLEIDDSNKTRYYFEKTVFDNGIEVVVTYVNDSVKIKYNDIFKVYSLKNDIIINCFDEFTYLDNGYYKNLSEGEYEIEIVLTYIEDKVVDVSTSVNRINTAYDNISMHIIDNNGDERVVDLTYLGLFNQCINITFITTFFDEHYISWSTNEKSHNVSLNESFYFEVDGFVLDVKLGRVIKGQYDNYFEIDNETGYIINKFGSFKNRNFYIFFEDDSIYFDLECIE